MKPDFILFVVDPGWVKTGMCSSSGVYVCSMVECSVQIVMGGEGVYLEPEFSVGHILKPRPKTPGYSSDTMERRFLGDVILKLKHSHTFVLHKFFDEICIYRIHQSCGTTCTTRKILQSNHTSDV